MIAAEKILEYLRMEVDDIEDPGPDAQVALDTADRVLSWIEIETGRHFREPKEFSLRLHGEGIPGLWLPELPLEDGESVPDLLLEIEVKTDGGTWQVVPPEDYELVEGDVPGPYLIERTEDWPMGRRNVRATFTAGYESGELPGDIELLVLEMVARLYGERGNEGLRSETIGGYSYSRADFGGMSEIPTHWEATLRNWKHRAFA